MNKNQKEKFPAPVRTPTILQFEAAECGAASLAIILGYYGKWIPLSDLRKQLGVSRDGTNILRLRDAARELGLDVKASRYIPGDFPLLSYPLICHWNNAHFLVLEGVDADRCFLSDPASGRRSVSHQEFFKSTPSRIILELQPTKQFVPSGQPPDIVSGFRSRLTPYRSVLLYLALLAGLSTIPTIGLAAVSSTLINSVLINGRRDMLSGLVVLAITLLLLVLPTFRLQLFLFRKFGISLARSLSIRYLTRLLALPIPFYDSRHAAELNQRLSLNEVFSNNVAGPNGQAVVGIVASFIYGLILLLISWPLALVCFLLQSLQLAILLGSRADRNDRAIQLAQAEGQLFATTYDSLRTIETIKSSGIEDQIFRRWTGYHARYTNQLQKLTGTTYQVNSISRLVNDLLTATILLGGGYLVIRGQLSIGWLVSFRMIYDSFSQPLLSLAGSWSQLEQLIGDVGKLDDVEHESLDPFSSLKELAESKINVVTEQATAHLSPTADEAHDDLPSQSHSAMALEIKALSFGYDNQEPATLSDLSLIIPAASRVAFVGETGCGKSTLLRVIAGLYTPRSGEVLYDGRSLQELTPGVLHARLAYVTQLSQVIEGTIQDNIALFDERYSEEDVIAAARSACIDADISLLPDGYLTNVGSAGFRFSGGQRQRINLARALIRAPGLLLMDEATSALDASTEELIVSNINQMNCTQIVVAHRLNTVVGCDQIYYFERGKIVESGTHQELLSFGGQYASQYQASKVGASR